MIRRLLTALLLATTLAAPAAAAPLPVAIVTIEAPGVPFGSSERVDRLIALLADEGLVDARMPELSVKRLKACGASANRVACARAQIAKRPPLALPLHLAVLIEPGPGVQLRLVCVGPRWHSPLHPPAEAYIDLDAALAEGPQAAPWRRRLVDCLDAAAQDRRI